MLRASSTTCRRHVSRALLRRNMLTGASSQAQPPRDKTAWQAEHNIDIQRVTQTAIIHELTQVRPGTLSWGFFSALSHSNLSIATSAHY